MPIIASAFSPPPLLAHGHVQTILPALLPRSLSIRFEPEMLELPDGDFLQLSWSKGGRTRLAILSHGLESDVEAPYMRGMAHALRAAGWDVLAWCLRGCGPAGNRLARSYHSGETGDLGAVVQRGARDYGRIVLVGFSLGGNITLKYLGEAPPHPAVAGGAAISAPVDLESSATLLDRRLPNRLYLRRFLASLVLKIEEKARRFPHEVETAGLRRIRTFREFDDRYTAPLHGFRDAAEYWEQCSSRQFLHGIRVPTLLLNARNDPMLDAATFPFAEAEQNPFLHLEVPASGGHVGFLDFRHGLQPWSERRVPAFFETTGAG